MANLTAMSKAKSLSEPRSARSALDETDARLLAALEADARLPLSELVSLGVEFSLKVGAENSLSGVLA